MSVVRVSDRSLVAGGNLAGKEVWTAALGVALDDLEFEAQQHGAEVDWDSLELTTDTDYAEESSLTGPVRVHRLTWLRTSALAVTRQTSSNKLSTEKESARER